MYYVCTLKNVIKDVTLRVNDLIAIKTLYSVKKTYQLIVDSFFIIVFVLSFRNDKFSKHLKFCFPTQIKAYLVLFCSCTPLYIGLLLCTMHVQRTIYQKKHMILILFCWYTSKKSYILQF